MTDTTELKPLPLNPSVLASLPQVAGVEVLPAGGAALHLEGGQVVTVPAQQNAAINTEYAPLVLRLDSGNCFVIPEPLKLPVMWALGFDLTGQDVSAAQVVEVEPLAGNRARLSLGGGYTVTLSRLGV